MILFGLGHLALRAHLPASSQLQRHRNVSSDESDFLEATLPHMYVHKDFPQFTRQAVCLFTRPFRLSLMSPDFKVTTK